jgi:hypothetical protein
LAREQAAAVVSIEAEDQSFRKNTRICRHELTDAVAVGLSRTPT